MFTVVKITNNDGLLIEPIALTNTFQEAVGFIEQEKSKLFEANTQIIKTNYNFTIEEAYFCYRDLKKHFEVAYKSLNLKNVYNFKSIYSDRNE